MNEVMQQIHPWIWLIWVGVLLAVWDIVWKLIALWKSARNGHLAVHHTRPVKYSRYSADHLYFDT